MATNEKVHFKMIRMPCCGQMLCWINPRLPNFCPECGKGVFIHLRDGSHVYHDDPEAILRVDIGSYIFGRG